MSRFRLSAKPIYQEALRDELANLRAGACVTFEGWVRNHHQNRPVIRLDYHAYSALAESEGSRIVEEALSRFSILDALCVHRLGSLNLGDLAVWVGVISAHRGAAFDACSFMIDEIKQRVPIWKNEYYSDGATSWIGSE